MNSDITLFQQSVLRVTGSDSLEFNSPITITNTNFRFIVYEQLHSIGIIPQRILIEPEVKNTAPAIIAATIFAKRDDEDTIIIVTPTDHVIPDTEKFHSRPLEQPSPSSGSHTLLRRESAGAYDNAAALRW